VHLLEPGPPCDDLLAPYAAVARVPRPGAPCWVLANMVGGLDGSAAAGGRVGGLSDAVDAELFRLMRTLADVVLVGAETVRREGYGPVRLPEERQAWRTAQGRPPTPPVAVVSRSLRLDWDRPLFTDHHPRARTVVLTSASSRRHVAAPAGPGADVLDAGEDRVDLRRALDVLAGRGARVVLCEGGPTLLGELVAADLLDELCLTVAPVMGGDPLPLALTGGLSPLARFRLGHVAAHEDTLFLRYVRP